MTAALGKQLDAQDSQGRTADGIAEPMCILADALQEHDDGDEIKEIHDRTRFGKEDRHSRRRRECQSRMARDEREIARLMKQPRQSPVERGQSKWLRLVKRRQFERPK